MTEGIPATLVQLTQLNRSLSEKVLDKAASDPQWKQRLLDDPEAAMREANFPELQTLEQRQQSRRARLEVTGQYDNEWHLGSGYDPNYYDCYWYSSVWHLACVGGWTQLN